MSVTLTALLSVSGCTTPVDLEPLAVSGTIRSTSLGRVDLGGRSPRCLGFQGSLLIVGCGPQGIAIVDASRSDAPVLVSTLDGVDAESLAVGPDYVLVAGRGALLSDAEVTRVDLLDPREPMVIDDTPVSARRPRLTAEGTSAAIAADALHFDGGRGRFEPIDVGLDGAAPLGCLLRRGVLFVIGAVDGSSTPAALRLITIDADDRSVLADNELRIPTGASISDLCLALGRDSLLIGVGDGLIAVDVTDPRLPAMVEFTPITGVTSIAAGGDVGALLRDDAIYLLDLAELRPTVAGRIPLASPGRAIAFGEDVLAVADASGVSLYSPRRPDAEPDDTPAE